MSLDRQIEVSARQGKGGVCSRLRAGLVELSFHHGGQALLLQLPGQSGVESVSNYRRVLA